LCVVNRVGGGAQPPAMAPGPVPDQTAAVATGAPTQKTPHGAKGGKGAKAGGAGGRPGPKGRKMRRRTTAKP